MTPGHDADDPSSERRVFLAALLDVHCQVEAQAPPVDPARVCEELTKSNTGRKWLVHLTRLGYAFPFKPAQRKRLIERLAGCCIALALVLEVSGGCVWPGVDNRKQGPLDHRQLSQWHPMSNAVPEMAAIPPVPHAIQARSLVRGPATTNYTLAWDPVPSAAFYAVYWGGKSKVYTNHIISQGTQAVVTLPLGPRYYFAATAVNFAALESDYSNEAATGGTKKSVLHVSCPTTNQQIMLCQAVGLPWSNTHLASIWFTNLGTVNPSGFFKNRTTGSGLYYSVQYLWDEQL